MEYIYWCIYLHLLVYILTFTGVYCILIFTGVHTYICICTAKKIQVATSPLTSCNTFIYSLLIASLLQIVNLAKAE